MKEFFDKHSLDARQVGSVFEELVRECLRSYGHEAAHSTDEAGDDVMALAGSGTVLMQWKDGAVHHPGPRHEQPVAGPGGRRLDTPSARGKYAHVRTGSEEFAGRKADELTLEDGGGR